MASRVNLYLATATADIGAFCIANHFTWTSPTLPMLLEPNDRVQIRPNQAAWIGSLVALGCSFGPLVAGALLDRWGRKVTITTSAVLMLISWIMLLFARSVLLMYIARVVAGIGGGIIYTAAPIYVAEIAEDELRGSLGTVFTLLLNSGFLLEYIVGPFVSYSVLILVSMVPPITLILVFPTLMPESPYYLLKRGCEDEAFKSLSWLRKGASTEKLKAEFHRMKLSVETSLQQSGTLIDLVSTAGNRKGLLLSCVLVIGQQLSGITVVLFYTQSIFEDAGASLSPSLSAVIVGVVLMVSVAVCGPLANWFGMKSLIVISSLLCGIFQGFLGLYFYLKHLDSTLVPSLFWLPITSLIGYVTTYSIGLGSLPWAVMAEMFPPNVKSIGSAISASLCWVVGFIVTNFFSNISYYLGEYISFWMFNVLCVLISIFTYCLLPNTRGMTLDEIQDVLNNRRRKSVVEKTEL